MTLDLKNAYKNKLNNEKAKGSIANITYDEFVAAWTAKPKFLKNPYNPKKHNINGYVMCRVDYTQPLSATNCQIIQRQYVFQTLNNNEASKAEMEKRRIAAITGKQRSKKTKQKISEKLTGTTKSEATKKKMAKAAKERWAKKRGEQTKQKTIVVSKETDTGRTYEDTIVDIDEDADLIVYGTNDKSWIKYITDEGKKERNNKAKDMK